MNPNLELTKDQFIHTSPNDIKIQIDQHQFHIFSENEYVIHIDLYNLVLSIFVKKNTEELNAFYHAIGIKFSNLSLPITLKNLQQLKTIEKKAQQYDKILKFCIESCKVYPDITSQMLNIIYRFVFDQIDLVKIEQLKDKTNDQELIKNSIKLVEKKDSSNSPKDKIENPLKEAENKCGNKEPILNEYDEEIIKIGYLKTKLRVHIQWGKFYAKLKDGCLFLYASIAENEFQICYILYESKIYRFYFEEEEILVITHNNEYNYLMISISNESSFSLLEIEEYLIRHSKIMKAKHIPILDKTNKFHYGKLAIEIESIDLISKSKDNFKIKTKFDPYVLYSRTTNIDEHLQINQEYFLPIHNFLGIIELDVVSIMNTGLLVTSKEELIIGVGKIPIPDIFQEPLVSKKVKIPIFVFQGKTDNILDDDNICIGTITVRVRNLSNFFAFFQRNPNKHISEDRKYKEEFNLADLKLIVKRMQTVILLFLLARDKFRRLLRFKYIGVSLIFYICTFLIIIFASPDQVLSILIMIFIIIFFINSNFYISNFHINLQEYLFHPKWINHYADFKVKTKEQIKDEKALAKAYLKKKKKKEKSEKKILKKKEGILGMYKKIRHVYAKVILLILWVCDVVEKIKNLIMWKDEKRTTIIFSTLMCLFFISYTMPLRFIFLLICLLISNYNVL